MEHKGLCSFVAIEYTLRSNKYRSYDVVAIRFLVFPACGPCMLIAATVVVWDQRWLGSKYVWIYRAMVSPSSSPVAKEVLVVWVNARDMAVATPSLVIWEAGEGSVTGYLIKLDWDFHRIHRRRGDGLPGGPIIDAAP